MSKEKFETVLDYGSSKLRIGIIDKNFPKNKFFLDQKIVDDSRIDEFNFENHGQKIYELIKKAEKKSNSYLNDINLMIDTKNFFCIDIALKKIFNNRLVKSKDIKNLLNILNSLIKNHYSKYKIIHFIVTRIVIDKKEFNNFPDNINCEELIIEVKFICLPNNIVNQLLENFKSNFLSIKKIYCTSYIKSYCIKDYFDRYENKFFFDIGYEKSCLVVYCKNKIKLVNFFPLGGNHVTKDIAKIFKISIEEAEKIKKNLNNSNITFSNQSDEKNNISITNDLKNIDVELLKRVVFARIDEIINFIFQDTDYSYLIKNSESSVLVFTGEGAKILDKNSILLDEKFNYFNEINFFDENSTLVCDSGYKFIITEKPHEISVVPKKIGKHGFFEKIFNYFK
tara:strand:- start:184 stop:1371 length:1188 start_codon:yes stop_codon:yes gene_type:complete